MPSTVYLVNEMDKLYRVCPVCRVSTPHSVAVRMRISTRYIGEVVSICCRCDHIYNRVMIGKNGSASVLDTLS